MPYEFLKSLFGTGENGQTEALTFEQLEQKITANGKLKLVNLADGGYVSKDKFDAAETKSSGLQAQLDTANETIKSYKEMDIDGIKKSATDWETKYAKDTKDLQDKLTAQDIEFAARTYLGQFKYANELVKDAIFQKFMEKKFVKDGDKFLGADDFMKEMKEKNPTGFLSDEPTAPPTEPPATPPVQPPYFTPSQPPAQSGTKKRSLTELMKFKNEHPDAKISYD